MQKAKDFWIRASLMFILSLGLMLCGWANVSALASGVAPEEEEIVPLEMTDVAVERLNQVPEEDFRGTDVLVLRTTFSFENPNNVLAEVRIRDFTVKIDDGTKEKATVLTTSMPKTYIPGHKEVRWSHTAPVIYGGLQGSFITRGVGDTVPEAVGKLNEVWKAMGTDQKTYYIDGSYSTSYPERPEAGEIQQFSLEYEIPEL